MFGLGRFFQKDKVNSNQISLFLTIKAANKDMKSE